MSLINDTAVPLRHTDRFFIGGSWVSPSTKATIDVIDSASEELYFRVAEAKAADIARAAGAARQAFDQGPWPRLSHGQRAEFLRAIAGGLRDRAEDVARRVVLGQAEALRDRPVPEPGDAVVVVSDEQAAGGGRRCAGDSGDPRGRIGAGA